MKLLKFNLSKGLTSLWGEDKKLSVQKGFGPDWCGTVGWPLSSKLKGLIPGQGTFLGCGPDLWLGAWERQPINVSFSY